MDESFDHQVLTALLQAYVDDAGLVDYAGLKADGGLKGYLDALAQAEPEGWPEADQVAFWINTYNAYTLALVIDHYPVATIKDITPTGLPFSIPFLHSAFQIRLVRAAGQTCSLDHVEHQILRKQFEEPRIHFALVCAAWSCPPLRREAFTGAGLDAQLDDQARTFLADPAKNQVPAANGRLRLSRIFQWFGGDFKPGVQPFLARYFEAEVRQKLENAAFRVQYLPYDWSLNDQAR